MKIHDYIPHKHDSSPEEVNFDISRMKSALSGERVSMPENLSREDFRAWMREKANKCRAK